MTKYRTDYPKEPIGDGNPYWRCSSCKRSVPEINGEISRHEEWCSWMKEQESYDEVSILKARIEELEEAQDAAHSEIDALFNMISDQEKYGQSHHQN